MIWHFHLTSSEEYGFDMCGIRYDTNISYIS